MGAAFYRPAILRGDVHVPVVIQFFGLFQEPDRMRSIALNAAQQHRLQRLARDAGRTPKTMLRFVLRDGFEACEEDVRENLAADAEFAAGKGVTHKAVMRRARAVIEAHARGHKQAA